jgi:hypothetical protein
MKPKDNYAFPRGEAPGMELRDWFAGMALQGFAAKYGVDVDCDNAAIGAYTLADSMLDMRHMSDEEMDEFIESKIER